MILPDDFLKTFQITGVTTVSMTNFYSATEQEYNTIDQVYEDTDNPLVFTSSGPYLVELNNNELTSFPVYCRASYKNMSDEGDVIWEFDCGEQPFTLPSVITTPISFTGDVTFDDDVEYTSSAVTTFDSGSNTTFNSGSTVNLNGTTTNGSSSTVTYSSGSNVTYNSGSTLTNNGTTTNNGNTTNSSSSTVTYSSGSNVTNNGTFNSSGGNLIIPTSVPASPVAGSIYSSSGNIVLFSSPTASQTWPAPAQLPTWQQIQIPFTLFNTSGAVNNVTANIATVPAGSVIDAGILSVQTNFAGGPTGCTMIITLNGDDIYDDNVQGTSSGNKDVNSGAWFGNNTISLSGTLTMTAKLQCTGGTLNTLTAGMVYLWLRVATLPSPLM